MYGATGDDSPTQEELEESRINDSGGRIMKGQKDYPKSAHYQIIRWERYTMYINYTNKDRWLTEVKRLAGNGTPFTAFEARKPVTVSLKIDVEVSE